MQSVRLPLTVIYGLPGSGKTTLSRYLLDQCPHERIALSEMYGGEAAFGHVHEIVFANQADYLLIEAGGSCQPESLATSLTVGLDELVRLDTMVSVVDTATLLDDFVSWERLSDRGLVTQLRHDRALVEALTEQIRFADVIVLNKVDQCTCGLRHGTTALIRALNPDARIIETQFGRVPPQAVLSTHRFELTRARDRARS
jgi:G3E family GTPase